MTINSVAVPGGHLNVVGEGDPSDPAVVLIHAGIADLRAWDDLVPQLVDAGYRVIRYDTRGFGGSPTEDVVFSNRADLVAVLDAMRIERAALVGSSRGGQIAFDTAIEFADRIVAVVGVGAGLGGVDGPRQPVTRVPAAIRDKVRAMDAPQYAPGHVGGRPVELAAVIVDFLAPLPRWS